MPKIIKPAKGSFTTADITIDSSGRVIAASSGAGGDGSYFPRLLAHGPSSGNFDTPANASKFYAFAQAGGGGGGGGSNNRNQTGGNGGTGGYGLFSGNVAASTTYAYAVGAAGTQGNASSPGNAGNPGGATNVTNLFTANGGTGGAGGPSNTNNNQPNAAAGTAPGATSSLPVSTYLVGGNVAAGGNKGTSSPGPTGGGGAGTPGGVGSLTFYDDGAQ